MADEMLAGTALSPVPAWRWISDEFMVMDADTLKPAPFVVFPWTARMLMDLLPEGEALPYQLALLSSIKKSGKTTLNGAITAELLFNRAPAGAEMYVLANSKEQSTGRVYRAVKYGIEHNPRLQARCRSILETITRLNNGTFLQSLAAMHMNIAGGNPYLSCWTELWGYDHEKEIRAWHEMTPPPTIANAIRVVDTYAGYDGESGLLNGLEDQAKAATRLYLDGYELPAEYRDYAERIVAQHPDWQGIMLPANETGQPGATGPLWYGTPLPVYVDTEARFYAYWDEGEEARRLPWQVGERGRRYYAAQAKEMQSLPGMFERLHLNRRTKRGGQFVPMDLWRERGGAPAWKVGDRYPVVLGVDAALRDDHAALVGVRIDDGGNPSVCYVREWEPQPDARADGRAIIDPAWIVAKAIQLARSGMLVAAITYDEYQFGQAALELADAGFTMLRFDQGTERLRADTDLANRIRDAGFTHCDDPALDAAVESANAEVNAGRLGDQRRIRIVKGTGKVDALVACSMASWVAVQVGAGTRWQVYD